MGLWVCGFVCLCVSLSWSHRCSDRRDFWHTCSLPSWEGYRLSSAPRAQRARMRAKRAKRVRAPIVVIFGTRVLCRPGKVIGYQKILSLASLAHAAQKKRAAGLQQPVRLLYRSVWRREAPHTSKLMSRRRGVSRAAPTRRRRERAARACERSEQNECAKRTSSPAGLAGGPALCGPRG